VGELTDRANWEAEDALFCAVHNQTVQNPLDAAYGDVVRHKYLSNEIPVKG